MKNILLVLFILVAAACSGQNVMSYPVKSAPENSDWLYLINGGVSDARTSKLQFQQNLIDSIGLIRATIELQQIEIDNNTAKETNATHTGEVTGSGALAIADGVIEAANLESTNAPIDNYIPSYDLASLGFTWVLNEAGGATDTALISDIVHDSLEAARAAGVPGVALQDSGVYAGGYVTPTMLDDASTGGGDMSYTDTSAMLAPYISAADTAAMLAPYAGGGGDMLAANNLNDLASAASSIANLDITATAAEISFTTDVTSNIQAQINAKLNVSDTATMLSNFWDEKIGAGEEGLAIADTAAMLAPYLATADEQDLVTLVGAYDYLTISGQVITRAIIDLTTDVTGVLPDANVANDVTITNISQVQDITSTAAELNVLDGIPGTLTATAIGYSDGVTSSIQTQLDAKASPNYDAVNNRTGTTYTFASGDEDEYSEFDNAAAITVTVPPNSSVAFPLGCTIDCEQTGAGAVTFAAGAGVTINSFGSDLESAGQFAVFTLIKTATDEWTLTGNL